MTSPTDPAALPFDAVLAVDPAVLAGALHAIPDGENTLLRFADGRRTVKEVIAASGLDASPALASLERLLDAGVLRVVPPGSAAAQAERDGSEHAHWFADPASAPATEPEDPTPSVAAVAPVAPPPVPVESPAGRSRARAWVLAAAVALGTVLLVGTWWGRGQQVPSPVPSPSRSERPAAEQPPPALSVTEPAPSSDYREAMADVGARYQAGDLAGAAAACRRAIAVDPSIGAGWMALGEVELAAGNPPGARVAFERYLAAEPEGRHAARVRALLERLRP